MKKRVFCMFMVCILAFSPVSYTNLLNPPPAQLAPEENFNPWDIDPFYEQLKISEL